MSIHIEKEFKCSCGRVFQNSQSFNGHKSHCKAHHLAKYGNTDKWELNKKLTIEHAKKANKQHKANVLVEKASKEASWIAEQHTCERCGKVMTEKFGSGRFCSRACANSRERSDEIKSKIRKTLQNTLLVSTNIDIGRGKTCKVCGKKLKNSCKTGFCSTCLHTTPEGKNAMIDAGKRGYRTMQANGTHKGWQSRNITSYAEQFWISVLDNNAIEYEREYTANCDSVRYFLDFFIKRNGKLLDLEIDGKQHTYEDRAAADVVRDKNLKDRGYIIYRIPWNEISSEQGKIKMQQKINNFLEFYSSL